MFGDTHYYTAEVKHSMNEWDGSARGKGIEKHAVIRMLDECQHAFRIVQFPYHRAERNDEAWSRYSRFRNVYGKRDWRRQGEIKDEERADDESVEAE